MNCHEVRPQPLGVEYGMSPNENAEREHSSAHNLPAVHVQLPRTLSQCSDNHSVSISVKKGKEYQWGRHGHTGTLHLPTHIKAEWFLDAVRRTYTLSLLL